MGLLLTVLIVLVVSFILALFSMRDWQFVDELKRILKKKKIKGAIVFFKNKTVHYSSKSSFSSSN